MKILIACEESQTVCKAFRAKGHEAYSCDILPCSGGKPEWHIQGDAVQEAYTGKYDMMIAHPPCTFLCNSGVRWLYNNDKSFNKERWADLLLARRLFNDLWNAPIEKKALENPIAHKYAYLPPYSQIIHPWQFGHKERKATCLWLSGLPLLQETSNVKVWVDLAPYKETAKVHHMAPGLDRARLRSVTYMGIAQAMADQWG